MELRDVGSGAQIDLDLSGRVFLVIVLRDTLADFPGGHANDRVGIGVVVWRTVEHRHAQNPLLH